MFKRLHVFFNLPKQGVWTTALLFFKRDDPLGDHRVSWYPCAKSTRLLPVLKGKRRRGDKFTLNMNPLLSACVWQVNSNPGDSNSCSPEHGDLGSEKGCNMWRTLSFLNLNWRNVQTLRGDVSAAALRLLATLSHLHLQRLPLLSWHFHGGYLCGHVPRWENLEYNTVGEE